MGYTRRQEIHAILPHWHPPGKFVKNACPHPRLFPDINPKFDIKTT